MLNFIFIFLTILEIILTAICIHQLLKLNKRVIELDKKVDWYGRIAIVAIKKFKKIIKKVNKVVSILSSAKFARIKKILSFAITTIQVMLLIKTLKPKNGEKLLSYKNVKKLLLTQITKNLMFKILCT